MGTVSEKLTYLNTTKEKLKDSINIAGGNLTAVDTFRSYAKKLNKSFIDIINNGIDSLYNNFPKVTKSGSNLDLSTESGKLKLNLLPNLEQHVLPSGYTQVDYIESSGTQYIDTGVNADNNLRVVLDISYTAPTTSNQNIGAIRLQSDNNARYHILSQSGIFRIFVNDHQYDTINIEMIE